MYNLQKIKRTSTHFTQLPCAVDVHVEVPLKQHCKHITNWLLVHSTSWSRDFHNGGYPQQASSQLLEPTTINEETAPMRKQRM